MIQTAHDVERVLAALPPHRLRKLHMEFPDIRSLYGTGVQSASEYSGASSGVNLENFTDLDTLIVHCGPIVEDVSRLRETLASWNPTRASSQNLILYTTMYGVWEGLWGDEHSDIFHEYAEVVEETSCVGSFPLDIVDMVVQVLANTRPGIKQDPRIFSSRYVSAILCIH